MDINEILSQARKNTKEAKDNKVSQYSTNVKPPKKLPRFNVNPDAIKAFLKKQKDDEIKKIVTAQKEKEELQKLRHASKSMKKANAMAKRTKDNLKVYKGEDLLGLYPEPKKKRRSRAAPSPPLSPDQDRRHKAFMKNIVPKVKVPGINDDDSDDGYKEPVLEEDERKRRKMEKKRMKARTASNLEFSDLLQLAEKHKNKVSGSSSSSEAEEESDDESDGSVNRHGRPLSAEERYQRERRKRRELEERLKMATGQKKGTPVTTSPKPEKHKSPGGSLAHFKIGKLNSGMSEESKRAKVKALMEKLKSSGHERNSNSDKPKSSNKNGLHKRDSSKSKEMAKSKSTSSLPDKRNSFDKLKSKQRTIVKDERSKLKGERTSSATHSSKTNVSKNTAQKNKNHRAEPNAKVKQAPKITDLSRSNPTLSSPSKSRKEKTPTNPYKHTVVKAPKRPISEIMTDPWAKPAKAAIHQSNNAKKPKPPPPPGKCTLSVTSESVKTNYPGCAALDPYIESYKRTGKVIPKFTPEMVARYKAAMILKSKQNNRPGGPPPPKRRYGVIDDDSDEYDSELEDFIADDDEEEEEVEDVDVSSQIKAIFGYDRTKYGRESEWELSRMDASYKDIEKEEKKSLRIAREEDAREAKLEEERMKRMLKNKHKR